jgi:adenylyltransferase/sulfurtransferase
MSLSEDQKRRYARQLVLPEIGREGQKRLLESKVLVIGAGGLGSPLLLYLAAAGVGTLGIIDGDRVDASNLQRQILFETADNGRMKTESARDALMDLNPDLHIITYPYRLDAANAEETISRYDIVADGSDNFATRFLAHDTCYILEKTLVSGAVIRLSGQLATYKAYLGAPHPCYRCFCPAEPPRDLQPSCEENGVLGAVAGVMGSLMAAEVIKELLGLEGISGHVITYDALRAEMKKIRLPRDEACPFCSALARSRNIA